MAPLQGARPVAAAAVLRSPCDLDAAQTACADDIVAALCAANGYPENPLPESSQILWAFVFADWDTSEPVASPLAPRAPAHKELTTHAGKLDRDLPPSTCAVRQARAKAKAAGKATGRGAAQPPSTAPKLALHRRAGMPAFLRARLDATTGGIDWFWTDGNGKGVDPGFVRLDTDLVAAQAAALSHHDETVEFYVECRNASLAAYWMKCRLLRYIGATPNGQRPMNPSAHDFTALQKPELLWPVAVASAHTSDALKAMQPRC